MNENRTEPYKSIQVLENQKNLDKGNVVYVSFQDHTLGNI